MKIIYYGQDALPEFNNPVVTVGAFDGLHTAHKQIVSQLIETAKNVKGQSILITFNPHPRTILDARESNIRLLTTLEERIQILSETQLDYFIVVPFDYAFSTMLPKEYMERFLIGQFKPHTIIAGYDHRFGMHGQGDIALLRQYAVEGYFNFVEIDVKKISNSAISSTRIRQSISKHQIREANDLLGYPYPLTGKVVTGDKLGRKIGFPTANLKIDNEDKLIPPNGIYAAICEIQGVFYDGLLYMGTSSATLKRKEPVIEVHILDFNAEIYGHEISIRVLDFIREDRNFNDLDALRNQIILDKQKILQSIQKYKIYSHPLSAPKTAIVLLNYNGEAYLRKYLGSLVRFRPVDSRIYVIDNHSSDGSCLYLEHHFPEVQIIRLQKNYGFAGGYNRGLAQIEADYYVLVNSDVEVDHDWISPMIRMMQTDPEVLAIQPKIRSLAEPGKFEYAGAAGGYLDILGYPFCKGRIIDEVEADQLQYDHPSEIFWSSGAAMLVKSAAFKAVGGFDQDYFAHQEEIDLCWRLKRIGGRILFCPESVVYHLGGGTLDYDHPRKTYLNFRNNLFTIFKNYPVLQLLYVIPIRLVLDVGIAFSYALKGKFLTGYKIFQAYVVAIINTVYLIHKRGHYNQLVKSLQFQVQNRSGQLKASIFLQFYFSGNRRFSQIPDQYFKHP